MQIQNDSKQAVVRVNDEMTIYTAASQKEKLLPLLPDVKALSLDLAAVHEIDSAGVQLLLLVQQECRRLHNAFLIENPSDAVVAAIDLLRLRPLLLDRATTSA